MAARTARLLIPPLLALSAAADGDAGAVRGQLLAYTRSFATDPLPAVRKAFYALAADGADADRDARYAWRSAQAIAAVRAKWGAAAEAKFAHAVGVDTADDDRAATIAVDGDHATVHYAVSTIRNDHLIRVDGRWLLDEAAYRADLAGDALPPDAQYPAPAMRQAAEDVEAGKYDDVDDLIDAVEEKLGVDAAPPALAHR